MGFVAVTMDRRTSNQLGAKKERVDGTHSHPSATTRDGLVVPARGPCTSVTEVRSHSSSALATRPSRSQAKGVVRRIDSRARRSRTTKRSAALDWNGKVIKEGDVVTVVGTNWASGTTTWMLHSTGVVVAVRRVRASIRFAGRAQTFEVPTRVLSVVRPSENNQRPTPA
jgi:hypothetical protein